MDTTPRLGSTEIPPTFFYLDIWPFAMPMLVVISPEGAYQACQDRPLPRFGALRSFMRPLTGGEDLVTMEGKQLQTWRTIFNPGLSASHPITLVPGIVKDTWCFAGSFANTQGMGVSSLLRKQPFELLWISSTECHCKHCGDRIFKGMGFPLTYAGTTAMQVVE